MVCFAEGDVRVGSLIDSQGNSVLAAVGDSPKEDVESRGSAEKFGCQDSVQLPTRAGEGR